MESFAELFRIEAHESEILCVEFSTPDSGEISILLHHHDIYSLIKKIKKVQYTKPNQIFNFSHTI